MKFIFFGSSPISVVTLDHLKEKGFVPSLVVTKPDRPKGRGLILTPSPVKEWALQENIKVITPEKIRTEEFFETLRKVDAEFAVLVSYGKIIPQNIIDLFPKGITNVHPSLLPKLRGPSPFEFTILNDMKDEVGVSIMLLNIGMDEGPILSQKKIELTNWPVSKSTLYDVLTKEGAKLLLETLEAYLSGNIEPKPQEGEATYSRIIEKQDGELDLTNDPYQNFLKYKAYEGWPGTYFFVEKNGQKIRVKITEASFEDNQFKILKVIPEGKKEIEYEKFKL